MSFFNMYLIAGGTGSADINAGTSIGAAQAAATTNGNWDATTGAFIAVSGTPFASTVVGDYASVYVDGATVAVFIGKVTTVTSSTIITVDVATLKYGTAPSTSATGRSCVINGSWNTEQVLAAGGLAGTTIPQSTKVNIKGNLTVTAARTISMNGATTTPLWFSGYNTNPGDLDNDTTNSLAKPVWTFNSTFLFTCSGNHQIWSGISVVGTRSGALWAFQGTAAKMSRCRCNNNSSNAGAYCIDCNNTNGITLEYSWLTVPTTATTNGMLQSPGTITVIGCVFDGSGVASVNAATNSPCIFVNCWFVNSAATGILASTAQIRAFGCTFQNITTDCIKWTGTPNANGSSVIGCIFAGANGGTATTNGINSSSVTTNVVMRACNDYYNVTNPEVGFGDSPAFFPQTDSAFPVTSTTNATPVIGANARNNGFPGIFENESFSSFADVGCVRHADPAGGSVGLFIQ